MARRPLQATQKNNGNCMPDRMKSVQGIRRKASISRKKSCLSFSIDAEVSVPREAGDLVEREILLTGLHQGRYLAEQGFFPDGETTKDRGQGEGLPGPAATRKLLMYTFRFQC